MSKCGHLIKGDPDRPCAQAAGHSKDSHRDAKQLEQRNVQRLERMRRNPEQSRQRCRDYYWQNRERLTKQAREYREQNREQVALTSARIRARERGTAFGLTLADVPSVPERCPILGMKLRHSTGIHGPDSASLDCLDPAKGYVPGNVWWISYKANRMKNDANMEELQRFAQWVNSLEEAA